jgi:hypothetical protein
MKYLTGDEVQIGDQVVADKSNGIVVCVIDTGQYSDTHPSDQWSYLNTGAMVETDEMGLVHYPKTNEHLVLVARKG